VAVTLALGNNNSNLTYSGVLSGSGGLTKLGSGTQILSNVTLPNTRGTRRCPMACCRSNAGFLPASGDVILALPGMLNLNFTGTNHIRHLYVDGVTQFAGVYSSNNLPSYITGPGALLADSAPELLCRVQVDKSMADASELVTFSGVYSGNNTNITSYAWDFDDNGSVESSGPTATRQYTTSGVYTVRLTIVNEPLETATYRWIGAIFIYPITCGPGAAGARPATSLRVIRPTGSNRWPRCREIILWWTPGLTRT